MNRVLKGLLLLLTVLLSSSPLLAQQRRGGTDLQIDGSVSGFFLRPDRTDRAIRSIDFSERPQQQKAASGPTDDASVLLSAPEERQIHPRENGLDMLGYGSAQWGPSGIRITVDTVRNSRLGGVSGTLLLEVWATTSVPVFGLTNTHFTLGSYMLGQLQGGYQFTNVDSGLRLYTPPPSGCYWVTLALLEFDGFVYRYQDLHTFPSRSAFGTGSCGSPPPTPPTPTPTPRPTQPPPPPPPPGPTPTPPPPPPSGNTSPCVRTSQTACLLDDRFEVKVSMKNFQNQTFPGLIQFYQGASSETEQSVSFYSFTNGNVEVFVKMVNACSGSGGSFWLFAAGATNAYTNITVRDSYTGAARTINNPSGQMFIPFANTQAFLTCP